MNRSKWKGPYIEKNLVINLVIKDNFKNTVKTLSRKSFIVPKFIGIVFNIYNGKTFLKLKITEEMIGHKLGEFSPTRKKFSFKKKKNIK